MIIRKKAVVSIIIPSYNCSKFLENTLLCLVKQSYQNWEAIIVDDGSDDGTDELVEKFVSSDERFKYIYQKNKGLASARNTGLKLATGKYVQYLDADDLLSNKKLELQVGFMEHKSNAEITYTEAKYFSDQKPGFLFANIHLTQEEWMCRQSGKIDTLMPYFIEGNILPVNCALISKEFLDKNHIRFDTRFRALEDWHFWLQCLEKGAKFQFYNDITVMALIRVHQGSMSRNNFIMNLYLLRIRSFILKMLSKNRWLTDYKVLKNECYNLLRCDFRLMVVRDNTIRYDNWNLVRKQIGNYNAVLFLMKELNRLRKLNS